MLVLLVYTLMSTPVKPNGIKEIDPEMVKANNYNIAMTILEKDAAEGEGMVVRYKDFEDKMSRLQFAEFVNGLASVSKMMSVINFYRPELFDKIMDTIDEPAEPTNSTVGIQPASSSQNTSEPAGVTLS